MMLIKTQPVIIAEPKQDEYSIGYVLRHRTNWNKMQAEQRAVVLKAAADYLESEAQGMRERAETMVNRDASADLSMTGRDNGH